MGKITSSQPVEKNRTRGRGGKSRIHKREKVNNAELRQHLVEYIRSGKPSERLGEMFICLVDNYATKTNFSGYSFLEEMKGRAIFFLLKYSKSFKIEKSDNAFAYCTQIVKNAFIQVIKTEKKHSETKRAVAEKYIREKDWSKKDETLMG